MKVKIKFSEKEVEAELYDTETTINKLKEELPFGNRAHVTEGEMYVSLPIVGEPGKELTQYPQVGDICYWEEANALLFILGKTKQSENEEPKTIDPVTVVGKINDDVGQLRSIEYRDKVVIEIKN